MTNFYEKSQQHVAVESVHDQDKAKYKNLESILYKLLVKAREGMAAGGMESFVDPLLTEEVKKLFNIKLEVTIVNNTYDMEVRYMPANISSSLTPSEGRKRLMKMMKNKTLVRQHHSILRVTHNDASKAVTADLKHGMVRCKYGTVSGEVVIGTEVLRNPKMTQGALTALFLHEIGHVFNAVIYSTSYDNQLHNINNAVMAIRGMNKDEIKFKMIGELKANDLLTNKQAKELNANPDGTRLPADLTSIVFSNVHDALLGFTQDGRAGSNKESEKLADAFAVRCGYGMELLMASKQMGELLEPKESIISMVIRYLVTALLQIINIVFYQFIFGVVGLPLVISVSLAIMLTILNNGRSSARIEHGTPHPHGDTRTNNIKRNVVSRAQATNFKYKKDLAIFLKDVEEVNKVGEGFGIKYKTFDTLFHSRSTRQHHDISSMLNNPLYLDMLEVKLLTM